MVSFTEMKLVPDEQLSDRLEEVKHLTAEQEAKEQYRVVKDRETGEHYLDYAYMHRELGGSGEEEWYHQLLPIQSDDVLGIVLGEQRFNYPDEWHDRFLRNGPEGFYVWFDPSGQTDDAYYEQLGESIVNLLQRYKKEGDYDEQNIQQLLEDIERLEDK